MTLHVSRSVLNIPRTAGDTAALLDGGLIPVLAETAEPSALALSEGAISMACIHTAASLSRHPAAQGHCSSSHACGCLAARLHGLQGHGHGFECCVSLSCACRAASLPFGMPKRTFSLVQLSSARSLLRSLCRQSSSRGISSSSSAPLS